MKQKMGVVMDPIQHILPNHDGTLTLLLAAQARGWELFYMEPGDLYAENASAYGMVRPLTVFDDEQHWFDCGLVEYLPLNELDVILMRKDPPFTMDYVYLTYLLELAEKQGTRVLNSPSGLRDANEKAFILSFPTCIAPTLVSANQAVIRQFIAREQEVILKPLDGMGGASIFYVTPEDKNLSVILENMTQKNHKQIMAQRYLPEIRQGDKRIILVNGEPIVPYALARMPQQNEIRANMAAGGKGHCVPLSARDQWLCQQIAPVLRQKGLFLVGLDVIGDYITEINVTSPTCMREISDGIGVNVSNLIIEKIS
ncbi:MAG: glutathione synthase [Legionellales bacterium]|nr:glutathione synthase [Legionellales bacterium]